MDFMSNFSLQIKLTTHSTQYILFEKKTKFYLDHVKLGLVLSNKIMFK